MNKLEINSAFSWFHYTQILKNEPIIKDNIRVQYPEDSGNNPAKQRYIPTRLHGATALKDNDIKSPF